MTTRDEPPIAVEVKGQTIDRDGLVVLRLRARINWVALWKRWARAVGEETPC
jgi:hypothetical protein